MLYHLAGYHPQPDMSAMGFSIQLFPRWKELVAKLAYTEDQLEHWTFHYGYYVLLYHFPHLITGEYSKLPTEEVLIEAIREDREEATRKYGILVRSHIRISWGEWGPEHISVPGDACSLDIDHQGFRAPRGGGVVLHPHNVDNYCQHVGLLTMFLNFADVLVDEERSAERSGSC